MDKKNSLNQDNDSDKLISEFTIIIFVHGCGESALIHDDGGIKLYVNDYSNTHACRQGEVSFIQDTKGKEFTTYKSSSADICKHDKSALIHSSDNELKIVYVESANLQRCKKIVQSDCVGGAQHVSNFFVIIIVSDPIVCTIIMTIIMVKE